ncbi:MAG: S8 family serine peptidase [Thaumarchaeota archaeon]|nr:S8 family serine peptidase [Nitrososphaerota archaeon]MCL5318149.1 S8 family serine peptidase [Nitrososphaerota archaeon]
MKKASVTAVILITLILLPSLVYAPSSLGANPQRVIVTVSDTPLTKRAAALGLGMPEAAKLLEPQLKQEVENRLDSLRRAGGQFRVIEILTRVLHGAVIETSQSIDSLKASDPSLQVYGDSYLQPSLERSSRLVGAVDAHRLKTASGVALTGKGVVVAVIDTGVDYTHPDLGGAIGPGQKVIGGYNFVDENNDPIDRDGHGTEVAGIVAANGRLQGIAPDASLLAYRVVDRMGNVKSSDLIRALERASSDGAKVVNLSLGTKEEISSLSNAVENLVQSGVVVVAAIGNSADRAFGEPAARPKVIAVGASLNNVTTERDSEVIVNPGGYEIIAYSMNGSRPAPEGGVGGNLAYVGYARQQDVASLDLRGKIALAERGGEPGELIYFSMKEANVAAKGAVGLIVYNSEGGLFVGNLIGPHNPQGYQSSIPVISISNADGTYLRKMLGQGEVLHSTIVTGSHSTIFADRVAVFSSRGPTSPFYIKPDILAPGVSVNTTTIKGGYASSDGTSFSAPHVTGAAALLLQEHPNLTPEEVAGVLAPTSKVMTDRLKRIVPLFSQGSGRLDVLSAALSPLAIVPHSFVFQMATGQPDQSELLKVIPIDGRNISVSADLSWAYSSNISLSVSPSTVNVGGNRSAQIEVTSSLIHASPGYYEGRLTLRPSGGYQNLTVPILVSVNNASIIMENSGSLHLISVKAGSMNFTKATVKVTSPTGAESTYILSSDDSVPIDVPQSGEYWITATIPKPSSNFLNFSGNTYAHAMYNISQPLVKVAGIPLRFFEILGGFLFLAMLTALVIVAVNRKNQRPPIVM